MTEQTTADQNPKNQTPSSEPANSQATQCCDQAQSLNIFIALCSIGIIGSFFLPWIRFLFGTPSGYQLQQLPSDQAKLVWFIPGAAILPLCALASKQGVGATACVAGITPFIALAYYLYTYGSNLFDAFQIGAYLTLVLGAILCILGARLSKTKA